MKISELKGKHDHALTSWLKVIIFSLLMIAPLFASISQWIYVSFNKNAKESYSGLVGEQYQNIQTNTTDMVLNNTYYFSATNLQNNGYTNVGVLDFAVSNVNYNNTEYNNATIIRFYPVNNSTSFYMQVKESASVNVFTLDLSNNAVNIKFTFLGVNSTLYTDLLNPHFYRQQINPVGALDNAFYYGVEKMTESDLFNWTQNTALYSGIKTMTDNLEIQTPAIAILLTYWFILTIIYVIIDIVLKGFTTLTHLIMGAKN